MGFLRFFRPNLFGVKWFFVALDGWRLVVTGDARNGWR